MYECSDEIHCEHFERGYGRVPCVHPDGTALPECAWCGGNFAESHHHEAPTAIPEQHCFTHDEWHPRCWETYECSYEPHYHCRESDEDGCAPDTAPDVDYRVPYGFHPSPPTVKAPFLRFAGVEIEAEGGDGVDVRMDCGITEDGSLDDGVEVQTPPAYGAELESLVRGSTDGLVSGGWSADSYRCGLHVHLDMRDHVQDHVTLSHVFAVFLAVEDMLYQTQDDPLTRRQSSYCLPLRSRFDLRTAYGLRAKSLMRTYHGVWGSGARARYQLESAMTQKYHDSRYFGVNFHSIAYHGTLEIRIHEGTLDPDRILDWINLLQGILNASLTGFPGYGILDYLYGLDAEDRQQAWIKAEMMSTLFDLTPEAQAYLTRRIN